MFTRLEFEWTHPHPPLSALDPSFLWVPTGARSWLQKPAFCSHSS